MNAIPYDDGGKDWDSYDDADDQLPGRPRRNLLNRWSALLFALLLGAVGFYVGIRVEKGQIASSPTSGAASALSRFASLGAGRTATSTSRRGAGAGSSGFPAGAGGFAAAFGGGGNDAIGTVSSVDGSTIYVAETSGDTIKVKLTGSTTITKDESVSKGKVYPGDTIVADGVKGSNGTITATTVSDSGTRASTTGSGATSSTGTSSGSSSGASAVSSLFGG